MLTANASVMCLGQAQVTPPSQQLLAPITDALRNHNFPEAVQRSDQALKAHPGDPRLWLLRGVGFSAEGRNGDAVRSFQRAEKLAPQFLPPYEAEAQIQFQTDSSRARVLLAHILAVQPGNPVAHAMLGTLAFRERHCDQAVVQFQQAGPALQREPAGLSEFAACLATLGRYAEAVPLFRQLAAQSTNQPDVIYNLALAEDKARDPSAALTTLQPLLEDTSAPQGEDVLTLAADLAEQARQTQQALDLLRKAMLLHPEDKQAFLDFANLAYQHGSLQVGIDVLDAGIRNMPKEPDLYVARGALLCQIGKAQLGLADFDTANRLRPNLAITAAATGIAESQEHASTAALAQFRSQVAAHPDDPLLQFLLAEALYEGAQEANDPDHKLAVRAAQRSLALNPDEIEAHDLLASIYLDTGQNERSAQESEAALKLNPQDEQALYHLLLATRKTAGKDQITSLTKRLIDARKLNRVNDLRPRLQEEVAKP